MTRIIAKARFMSYDIEQLISDFGADVLAADGMEYEKTQEHHGCVSCFEHSVAVAYISLWIAKILRIKVDTESLVRGALLHDYFLYDWHEGPKGFASHNINHAKIAYKNAKKEFSLNKIERDIILKHMFPITPKPPVHKESILVCIADKLSAILEIISLPIPKSAPGIKAGKRLSN